MPDAAPFADLSATSQSHTDTIPRRWIWLAVLFLTVAVALAYSNAFQVPFLFDDEGSIITNKTIRSWRTALFPPGDTGDTVGGRPLLNLSIACNYAISGTSTWSYHLTNILIHLCAGWALFGLVRRTLAFCGWSSKETLFYAFAATAFWLLHPLQTESVTYIVQRAESLMALWYLLTLYCFSRAMGEAEQLLLPVSDVPPPQSAGWITRAALWRALSVVTCALGMGSKEVMVSAPVLVLLYDRAFVAGSFGAALRLRRKYYMALAATWLVLVACLAGSGFRGGTTGFSTPMTWWMYALRQCEGIVIYLKLVFWPAPLTFDYGVFYVTNMWSVFPQMLFIIALAGVAFWAMFARPRIGILGALFFAVLSPSSSVLPVVSQTLAEHRMYLPLAAVVVFIVVACRWLCVRWRMRVPTGVAVSGVAGICLALGAVTWSRNTVMHSVVSIWMDTVAKVPRSHRAQNNLGCALIDAKRYEEGIPYCMEAVRLKPDYGEAYGNIAYGLSGLKRHAEAIPYYEHGLHYMRKMGVGEIDRVLLNMGLSLHEIQRDTEARAAFEGAVAINPKNSAALNNIGNYEFLAGRYAEAKAFYQRAVEADPEFAEAWYDLGNAVVALGEPWNEAERLYRHALKINPNMILAQDNLGRLLLAMKRPEEASAYFNNVVRENPSVTAQLNAARASMLSGKHPDAIPLLQAAIKAEPNNIEAHYLLGNARYRMGDRDSAMIAYRQAIQLNPFAVEPHGNLGSLLASAGQWDEAITELNAALRLKPDYAEAHNNLANAFAQQGHDAEARPHYEEALRLKPDLAQAHYNYARLLLRAGDIGAARQHAQKAITLRPEYSEAQDFLSQLP